MILNNKISSIIYRQRQLNISLFVSALLIGANAAQISKVRTKNTLNSLFFNAALKKYISLRLSNIFETHPREYAFHSLYIYYV
jgi:hypothetical protein